MTNESLNVGVDRDRCLYLRMVLINIYPPKGDIIFLIFVAKTLYLSLFVYKIVYFSPSLWKKYYFGRRGVGENL